MSDGREKRTRTDLRSDRPGQLKLTHQKLDEAVFAAYGWKPSISDQELLERLLAMNLQYASKT